MGEWAVCAAWPYVNDKPHLGTFIHLLSADVYARYLRLKGEEVVLVSGSDEHGTPIEVEALKRGVAPGQLTGRNHQLIVDLMKRLRIEFDNYTRTESKTHIEYVRDFYSLLERNGYVYERTLTLPFCENDQRFLPDRFVEGECPHCHFARARGDQCDNCNRVLDPTDLIKPYCVLCNRTPVLRQSKHWFFDLPKLADPLQAYVRENPNFPENARNFSMSWFQEGLKPRSLTRDNSWGIPAPFKGAGNKTLYVWMEAVLGYVSATKEWAEKEGKPQEWRKYWLAPGGRNVHFIGKDNIPFHTIIFPGLLLGTEESYNLPWQVSSTEFYLFDGQRFSKSRGVGVWVDEALAVEDAAELWRYALISLRPEQKDVNFTWEEFERKVNTELNDAIGNFVHRTISFIQTNFNGQVPGFDLKKDPKIITLLGESIERTTEKLDHFRLKEGLETILDLAREGNKYLNENEPWRMIKTDRERAGHVFGVAIQFVWALSVLLQPFLPDSSSRIRTSLAGEAGTKWADASQLIPSGQVVRPLPTLFHKVSAVDLRKRLDHLRSRGKLALEAEG